MPYDPSSTVARPLLALASSPSSSGSFPSSHHRRHPLLRRARALLLLAAGILTLLALTVLFGPSVGLPELPILERLAGYYRPPPPPAFPLDGGGGNKPPPPLPVDVGTHAPLDGPPPSSPPAASDGAADAAVDGLRAFQPTSRVRYSLKTGPAPPREFDAFMSFARERGCLVA
ncbi:hypothetical protein FB451DRAFT_1498440 [Mycena latifolia]|nr:hypothetical protein FB451DRAFT_1498440 [Mycena latifolia]